MNLLRHLLKPAVTDQELDAQLAHQRAKHPEISEDEALTDLFHLGLKCQRTYAAFRREERRSEDRAHGVIESIQELRGGIILSAPIVKPGVHRFTLFRRNSEKEASLSTGYCTQSELRVAIEQGIAGREEP